MRHFTRRTRDRQLIGIGLGAKSERGDVKSDRERLRVQPVNGSFRKRKSLDGTSEQVHSASQPFCCGVDQARPPCSLCWRSEKKTQQSHLREEWRQDARVLENWRYGAGELRRWSFGELEIWSWRIKALELWRTGDMELEI
ncbi:uncharacterized [Tachysurus ichikawai]